MIIIKEDKIKYLKNYGFQNPYDANTYVKYSDEDDKFSLIVNPYNCKLPKGMLVINYCNEDADSNYIEVVSIDLLDVIVRMVKDGIIE